MRVRLRFPALATVLVCVGLALAGCGADPVAEPARPSIKATDAPVFASDAAALAAASAAYAAYLSAGEAAGATGSQSREAYLDLTTGTARQAEQDSQKTFDKRGWRTTGKGTFDSMRIQSVTSTPTGAEIRTYLCFDIAGTDVVDAAGLSVVSRDRLLRIPLEVAFVTIGSSPRNLLISESNGWQGNNFC
jgi:hypothetical protein